MAETPTAARRRRVLGSLLLKQLMAVTGVIFVGFVVVHLVGNLKIYGGAAALDGYAVWLREVGYPLVGHQGVLWALRVVLLLSLVVHVLASFTLWLRGRRARGGHRRRRFLTSTARGAQFMLPTGLLIGGFVGLHLMDLTLGRWVSPAAYTPPSPDGTIHAYANVVASFQRPWMAAVYVVAMLLIGAHVAHGWRMVLQDVGVTAPRVRRLWVGVGAVLALAIVVGNGLIPILVQLGVFT